MCFNANVSISTWLIGMVGCAILFYQKYLPEAIFFGTVIQMQLIEYFLWQNQGACNKTNELFTKLGVLINHFEPIALWIGIMLFSRLLLPSWVHALMVVYIICSILYTQKFWKVSCTKVSDESYPHLHWKWNAQDYSVPFYVLFIVVLVVLSLFGLEQGYILATLVVVSFAVSFYIYSDKQSVGAMWCFLASFGPWFMTLAHSVV